MAGKWLELLKEIAPDVTRAALLYNPDTAAGGGTYFLPAFEAACQSLAVKPIVAPAHNDGEIESVIAALAREPGGGFVVMSDGFMRVHRMTTILAAARHRVPGTYGGAVHARDGGLLSYGEDVLDQYRRAAVYLDRVLRGEKPANLPVQVPTKFELVINLKTAKALGLTVPASMQQLADEVIE